MTNNCSDNSFRLMHRGGCSKCNGSGYKGRLSINELLICTASIRQAVKDQKKVQTIQQIAIDEGMQTLKMDGINKILAGVTDLEQVQRVCL